VTTRRTTNVLRRTLLISAAASCCVLTLRAQQPQGSSSSKPAASSTQSGFSGSSTQSAPTSGFSGSSSQSATASGFHGSSTQAPAAGGASTSSIARTQDLLPGRNRSRMYPGDPFVIVGIDQGDNDLRSKTPVLAQSDRASTFVNPDENYQRTVDMYEHGAKFTTPLLGRTQVKPYVPRPGTNPMPAPASDAAVSVTSSSSPWWRAFDAVAARWPWLVGALVTSVIGVFFLKRFGRSVLKPGTS
jgi:hypothetical protein